MCAVEVIRTKSALRARLDGDRRAGLRIGLVPTMGSLHAGHLSLIEAARAENDVVVMSLFVNPAQFGAGEDLDSYPRDEERDVRLAGAAGTDIVYAPDVAEVYPHGFSTEVRVSGVSEVLCGDPSRRGPGHFDGVTTVVSKLLNSVAPDVAYFGQKDAQQVIVVKKMVADLDFPVTISAQPTVREQDGVALSSRNAYLTEDERPRAAAISRALNAVRERAVSDELTAALEAGRRILEGAGLDVEYLEARDAETLADVHEVGDRPVLVAAAVHLGRARLIDNVVIDAAPSDDTAIDDTARGDES
ncbi:pantoate--beta-alanine ligase [Spelaeicoccus albus]|uniref:Pantothenate synthetase n=1 Tax=Spelaeicoccus albus TaxID=1280376 RepID=A0A7Z0AAX9_9MICO|nr:pantoate--beta-alanine ligase [Spelaeicoccus albus]NYI65841.1 pantoate--beta-alanine ligase [Spelaeicoccus albus]